VADPNNPNNPIFAASPRGPFAVTPSFAASPRGPFAITPSFAASPRGPFAVTPGFAASSSGPFDALSSGTGGTGGGVGQTSIGGLPEQLQRIIADAILQAKPERATDIFYEDEANVFIMRQGQQFHLRQPESIIWTELGTGTTSEIIDRVAKKLESERNETIEKIVLNFLLAGEQAKLLVLFPAERTERRTNVEQE
jgi:hypothetical protein